MVHQDRLSVETRGHRDIHDITERIAQVVKVIGR